MKIIRHVPTEAALMATAALDEGDLDQPFYDWLNQRLPALRFGTILDATSLPHTDIPILLTSLHEAAPSSILATAWATAIEASATLTARDKVRPYDEGVYDAPEEQAARDNVLAYATTLRETTPLLDPIADTITAQAMTSDTRPFSLGDLATTRALITDDGINLADPDPYANDGWCDKHQEQCYAAHDTRTATWAHLEALHPGIQSDVTRLLAALDWNLPILAANDNGTARMPQTVPA